MAHGSPGGTLIWQEPQGLARPLPPPPQPPGSVVPAPTAARPQPCPHRAAQRHRRRHQRSPRTRRAETSALYPPRTRSKVRQKARTTVFFRPTPGRLGGDAEAPTKLRQRDASSASLRAGRGGVDSATGREISGDLGRRTSGSYLKVSPQTGMSQSPFQA